MTVYDTLTGAQRGLPLPSVFGQVLTIELKDHEDSTRQEIMSLISKIARDIASNYPGCGIVAAFNPELWGKWYNRVIPIDTTILGRGIKFRNTGGDVLLYVKAGEQNLVSKIMGRYNAELDALAKGKIDRLTAGKRRDFRVGGGRYNDGITNPNDPISLAEDILVSSPPDYRGSSFAFTQKFEFDWPRIATQSAGTSDEMIGRNPDGASLPQHATNSHIHRAHIRNKNLDQRKILRQGLSFGKSGGHAGREKGLMFVAFCNEQLRFEKILKSMIGTDPEAPLDRLLDVIKAISGGYWYVPAAAELGVPAVRGAEDIVEDQHWDVRSPNGYLFYNNQDWLHQMSEKRYVGGDPPSDRVLSLMSRTFSHWRDGWMKKQDFPRLPKLTDYYKNDPEEQKKIMQEPVPIRKAMANLKSLTLTLSHPESDLAHWNGLLRLNPKELIVGVIPDFTLGRGKEVVPYLSEDETMKFWLQANLNEWSAMGHIVPDFERLVNRGLGNLCEDLRTKIREATQIQDSKSIVFYQSALLSLQGVQGYLRNWQTLTSKAIDESDDKSEQDNMKSVSQRLGRLVDHPPESFQDATQLIFTMHVCLHLVGELTALGRLDQMLWPFLEKDLANKVITLDHAQEIIDCLCMKIGEHAFVNRNFISDYLTFGTTTVNGVGGNFPQGGGINQWVQQITVGGYKALDGDKPEGGANTVTMLFLKAARRLPVNAPTVSLRVYKDIPEEYLDEAAKGILSGGAQPILFNDDKLTEGLFQSGKDQRSGQELVSRKWARNYAADGCYEPMFAGASDFTFSNVEPMLALEQTLNEGATYGAAGPEHLRGLKQTFRTPPASKIKTFKQLQDLFLQQLEWLVLKCYRYLLSNYGNLAEVCPSPLLSVLIDGCVEKGLDLTSGGALFHIMAPMCIGVSNTIDSLYTIKKLVFDPDTATMTLPDLVDCLVNDWGFDMVEPFQDQSQGPATPARYAVRYQQMREAVLLLPKWGGGDDEVNELGDWFITNMVRICVDTIKSPHLDEVINKIHTKYGIDFNFVITPGIGTFEGYTGDGLPYGASADGRRKGSPIASDLSPAPSPQDKPANPAFRNIYQAMKSCESKAVNYGLSNASPVDMNIDESFPLADMQRFVKDYAQGKVGGNLITITCADLKTFENATRDPEKYNLVRVRMGGWTEFYATMFPAHQQHHQRRQRFTPNEKAKI